MPRPRSTEPPPYRLHKQSGQAVVTLRDANDRRRDVLLGQHGTPRSRAEYARVIAEWEAAGRRLPARPGGEARPADLTINELCLAYWRFAEGYYVKGGEPTSEQDTIRQALRFLRADYGHTQARDFGPLSLKAVRQRMIDHTVVTRYKEKDPGSGKAAWKEKVARVGLARRFINKQLGRIKRMFAWGVEEELVPAETHAALAQVKGLGKGRGQAREKPRVRPVPSEHVEATLPLLPPTVADMVRVQLLCGGRPQDVVALRGDQIDRAGAVWEFRPARYKTEHRNEDDSPDLERVVYLGPRAQVILAPYLQAAGDGFLFSPRRAEEARNAKKRAGRKTPRWPSHQRTQAARAGARKRPALGEHYSAASYRRAVRRACQTAGVPVWCPVQLRHSGSATLSETNGGAIHSEGPDYLTVLNNAFLDNAAIAGNGGHAKGTSISTVDVATGGAIANDAGVHFAVDGCTFSNNRALGGSNATSDSGNLGQGLGGAIVTEGVATITNSSFDHNLARGGEW
jgi:integrase